MGFVCPIKIGYDAVYVSGGVMANDLGFPDIGLTTLQDVSTRSYLISRVTNLPTIVDIDTGFKSCKETIETFDAQIFYTSAKFYTALTYYQSNQQDTIVRVRGSDGIQRFFNSGEIDYEGIEWEGKIQLLMNLELTGSLTYQTNEDEDRVQDVGLVPNFMAKQGISYSSPEYTLGLFHSYFGDAASFSSVPERNPPAEAYHLLTLKGSMGLNPWLPTSFPDISANLFVDNLLDEDINFVAVNSTTANTLPLHRGLSLFGTFTIKY